jgi:outer membrane protein assembly factor BamB
MGYAGPAVTGGRVYITDFKLADPRKKPGNPFSTDAVPGNERVLCLDEGTGKILWEKSYPCVYEVSYPGGPRTTPLVQDGKVYTLGTMGDLLCLDAGDGKVLWSKNLPKDFEAKVPFWGFAAHPLVDGDKLICLVGGKDSGVVAFHKDTGKEIWRALSVKEIGYCPPMIYELGGKRQLIIWHPTSVNGLDPETGKPYWSQEFAINANLTVPTPRQDQDLLFLTSFYNGPIMLRFEAGNPTPAILWKGKSKSELASRTDGLHSIMPTPFIKDGYIYGVCSYGELRCLEEATGKRLWMTHQATGGESQRWANAFLVPNGDRFFLFNEKGELIIARLSPKGYEEISRAPILKPTNAMPGRLVVWSHPAFADKCMFARNDAEIVCVALAADQQAGR